MYVPVYVTINGSFNADLMQRHAYQKANAGSR